MKAIATIMIGGLGLATWFYIMSFIIAAVGL